MAYSTVVREQLLAIGSSGRVQGCGDERGDEEEVQFEKSHGLLRRLIGQTHDHRYGALRETAVVVSHAPMHGAIAPHAVAGLVAFGIVAIALIARSFAAAVVVAHEVVTLVGGVLARADPGYL
jgi:hypothetical protein